LDWLIVMGGPMSVYEENIYPWLKDEKIFIRKAIDAGKTVIGICLGSQFIADVLGAKVYPNNIKEIGWLNVTKAAEHEITRNFQETFSVFQWHGDTFDIPEKAVKLFQSEVCSNQAFIFDNRVLALQFHYEATAESINEMLIHGADELIPAATVQSAQEIRENIHLTTGNNERMYEILDYLAKK
jgi:GMP synthase-like glutamine amidotransferase